MGVRLSAERPVERERAGEHVLLQGEELAVVVPVVAFGVDDVPAGAACLADAAAAVQADDQELPDVVFAGPASSVR